MTTQKSYYAKTVKIGLIGSSSTDYYIDIVDMGGNWQTIATGNLKYVKSHINKIIFI